MRGVASIDKAGLAKAIEVAGFEGRQNQLAADVGISPQYLTDIVKGRRTLKRSPALRQKLADALDVPRRWIERPDPTEAAA